MFRFDDGAFVPRDNAQRSLEIALTKGVQAGAQRVVEGRVCWVGGVGHDTR